MSVANPILLNPNNGVLLQGNTLTVSNPDVVNVVLKYSVNNTNPSTSLTSISINAGSTGVITLSSFPSSLTFKMISVDAGNPANTSAVVSNDLIIVPTATAITEAVLSALADAGLSTSNLSKLSSLPATAPGQVGGLALVGSQMALTDTAQTAMVASLLGASIEAGIDLQQALKLLLAVVAGKLALSVDGSSVTIYSAHDESVARITSDVDALGNRSNITLNYGD